MTDEPASTPGEFGEPLYSVNIQSAWSQLGGNIRELGLLELKKLQARAIKCVNACAGLNDKEIAAVTGCAKDWCELNEAVKAREAAKLTG